MKRIITDTNIWYDIKREDVIKLREEDFQLVVPIIILNELYTSPKIYSSEENFNLIKKALKAILENLDCIEFVNLNPFEYLIACIYPELEPKSNYQFYISEFEALMKLNYDNVKDNHLERFDISGLTNFINETSISYGAEINKHQGTKDKFVKLSTIEKTKELIIKYTNENLEAVGNYPKLKELNPENELFAIIFDKLLRTASKVGTKVKDNDWIDIFLLTYIGHNDLYWTKEKSKLNLFENTSFKKNIYPSSYS